MTVSTVKLPQLSLLEARVLGVLAEKQRTVPDAYPLTLNALVAGCNQKSSRNPVLDATEAEVQAAVDSLRGRTLVIESSGGRVPRYEHNIERVLQIPSDAVALLAVLLLRGAQTPGELRINGERLHKFADIGAVEALLQDLATRPAGALLAELPRRPGSRENRWAHLLCGTPEQETVAPAPARGPDTGEDQASEVAALRADVARLESELQELQRFVAGLHAELEALRKTTSA